MAQKAKLNFKLGEGHEKFRNHIRNLKQVFSVESYKEILLETGETIKTNVENNIIKSKAIETRRLLNEIQSQSPEVHVIRNTAKSTRVMVGVGNMYKLNKIRREPRTVQVTLKSKNGRQRTRTITFNTPGTVPYWVILEYGSLRWAESPPPFIRFSPKQSSSYRMRFWGWTKTTGGTKPVISMVPERLARPYEKPHPGVRPRSPFRRALRTVALRNKSLENRLLTKIRRALSSG